MGRWPLRPNTSVTPSSQAVARSMGRADALKFGPRKCPSTLARAKLPVDTASLARYLIGKILVREMAESIASGRIVETEAYGAP